MKRYKHLFAALLFASLTHFLPPAATAQSVVNMIHNDSIILDACTLGSGTIYDDGGPTANYSNLFNGSVHIVSSPGATITLTGTYSTESGYDKLTVTDGTTELLNNASGTGTVNLVSNSGEMTIRFVSDGGVVNAGLALQWAVTGGGGACTNAVHDLDTSALTPSSVHLQWQAANASGPFVIEYNGQTVGGITTTSHTLTGLNAASRYTIAVTSAADSGNRCCAGYTELRTPCGNVYTPYFESFEDWDEGQFPDCWLTQRNFDDEDYIPQIDATHFYDGHRSLMLSCGGNNTGDHFGMVATPPFEGTGARSVHLRMASSSYGNTQVTVGLCDSGGSEYNNYGFTPLQTLSVDNTWREYYLDWVAPAPGKRLAFRMQQSMQTSTGTMVYIDGLGIESCAVDSLATSRADYDRITLTWSTFGSPTCRVTVRPYGSAADTLTFEAATSPLVITGLHPERSYTFTVTPWCDSRPSLSRSITASTTAAPSTSADYCSNFSQGYDLPEQWTFLSSYFSYSDRAILVQYNYYDYTPVSYMVSERLLGLAGKRVAVTYSMQGSTGPTLRIGTTYYSDDVAGVSNTATYALNADGMTHTLFYDIPATDTNRYIAIGISHSYNQLYIHAVEIGDSACMMGDFKTIHRRGTTVELEWDRVYDTVVVESCLNGMPLGTGQVDTFYNVRRGTVQGLNTSTNYDIYVHRPCRQACTDRFVSLRTATRDYPLPYCEDFGSIYYTYLSEYDNDWREMNNVNNSPRFNMQYSSQYEDYMSRTLELASWGFEWSYYAQAMLPDVELDSTTYLSLYVRSTAPASYLLVERFDMAGTNPTLTTVIDTLHLDPAGRRHYCISLTPSQALFDGRMGLTFKHPYQYIFYRCYIDEMSFAHSAYGNLQLTGVGHDTASLVLDTLYGTDSVLIRLLSASDTIDRTFGLADLDSIVFDSLTQNTNYKVFVMPYGGGCMSYALSFRTPIDYGGGSGSGGGSTVAYKTCFTFDDVLSYELPTHWAASGTTAINANDEMTLQPGTAVAMHPMRNITGSRFVFNAASTVAGDTLLLGHIEPFDTIDASSATFTFDTSLFTVFDTLLLDTIMTNYAMLLPATAADGRIAFVAGQGTVRLDGIGISTCPLVTYSIKGNVVTATCVNQAYPDYNLYISDSASNDVRTIHIDESPFSIMALQYDMPYRMEVLCDGQCSQVDMLRTAPSTPLPYCLYFNQNYSNITLPDDWTVVKSHTNDEVRPTSSPALEFYKYNNYSDGWIYAVLPKFKCDSALSIYADYYTSWYNDSGVVQIGVMDNETDTSTFVPIYSQKAQYYNSYYYVSADLSQHADKRVAIRCRRRMSLYSVRVYGYPLASYSLPHARTLRASTSREHPYWLNIGGYYSTMEYVDHTPADISINSPYAYVAQADNPAGTTCENNGMLYLGDTIHVPFCLNFADDAVPYNRYFSSYRYPITYNGYIGYNYSSSSPNGRGYMYLSTGGWLLLPELVTDTLPSLGMSFNYSSTAVGDSLVVGVMTNAYDTLSFVPVDTLVYTLDNDRMENHYVSFASYADSGRWVALHCLHNTASNMFRLHGIATEACPGAAGATVSLLRWNRVKIDAPAVPFYAEYGKTWPTSPDDTTVTVRVDSLPFQLTLEPETYYNFRFHCDSAADDCHSTQRVRTLAAPISVPSCVDFDTFSLTAFPKGWVRMSSDITLTDSLAHSSPNALRIPIGTYAYVITPDADIDSLQHLTLSLWYYTEDPSDRLVVGVANNPDNLASYHPIKTLAAGTAGTWQRGLVEFSSVGSDQFFIVLRARSNRRPEGRSVFVDDIRLDTSIAFDLRVRDISSNSITLDWEHRGSPNVTLTVLDDNAVQNVYTNAVPPLTIEPLSMMHYYTFLFESICGTDAGYCNTSFRDTLSVITPTPGVGCVNATDLNSPQSVFFTGRFDNPYMEAGAVNYGSLHPDSRHTVCYDTAQRDPRTQGLLRTIPEGYTSSVRLGNWSTNYFEPEAEGAIYSLLVDTSSFELLLLRYAAVLQDPIHAASDQPRFRMELLDTNYNIIDSACTSADFIADQSLGWHTAPDGVLWKDWTAVGIDLSAYAGQQVFFRLTTYDCNEGSHYGYAYFTLECMRKNMNTEACGAVATNTLTAPEGFNYRWYTSLSPATVGTTQQITVPSQDVTYFCDVSKLDNPSCYFTISAYGGTRFPMAIFDTAAYIDSCRLHMNFTNHSAISKDGITPMPGTECETYFWDFGNGQTSTDANPHAVYSLPGTYTVTLVSGIADHECEDTARLTFTYVLPYSEMPSDTTDASICSNQQYAFRDTAYTDAGTHYRLSPSNMVCDSLHVLNLEVRLVSQGDTTAHACDSIRWHGNTYTTDGDYLSAPVGLNTVGCDSSMLLHLTVSPTYDTVDTLIICPGFPYSYRGVDYGGPLTFDTTLLSRRECDSVVHVTLRPRDTAFHLRAVYNLGDSLWLQADSVIVGCAPASLLIADSTDSSYSREWQFFTPDTMGTSIMRGLTLDFPRGTSDSVTALVMLRVESEGQCWDTAAWPVVIMPSPQAEFYWIPDLPAMHSPDIQFDNRTLPEPLDSLDFLWQIQSAQSGEDTSTAINPAYSWGKPEDHVSGDKTVRLIAYWHHSVEDSLDHGEWLTDSLLDVLHQPLLNISYPLSHTCPDTVEHTVTITNDYLQFPNLVSPNGDGTNDTWMVVNLVEYSNYSMNELWIYDRSGTLVYHVKNIHSHSQDWDPNATNSPDGTYYYRFTAKGMYGIVKRNGIIEVLRD